VELSGGISQLRANTGTIASSAGELYSAAVQLNSAIGDLRNGLASYKDGTRRLKNEAASMDSEINSRIDEILDDILGGGAEVVSFVSDKNNAVNAVQFLMKTDAITPPEKAEQQVTERVELSFWQKFLKLFGA
jgi:putative membrane protein